MRFIVFLVVALVIVLCVLFLFKKSSGAEPRLYDRLTSLDALGKILPHSVQELNNLHSKATYQAQIAIAHIIAVPDEKRTYANTVQPFDELSALSDLAIVQRIANALESLSPHDELRESARLAVVEINNFFVEQVMQNAELFKAFKAYVDGNSVKENLTDAQRYFITETMKDFERAGLLLPADKRAQLLALDKEITKLCSEFDQHIADEKRTLTVPREALAGLDDHFIGALKRTEAGDYILGLDYPTVHMVSQFCAVEDTRKQLSQLFHNRAYPTNKEILEQLLAKRYERAQLVGFANYAAYDFANQMAQTPETVDQFLKNLLMRAAEKEEQELVRIIGESVLQEQVKPWNLAYLKEQYKKEHYAIDENKLREYFPMEKTIQGLIKIYEQFFGLKFVKIPALCLWHDELYALEARDGKTDKLLGIFILDLHPRPNKFSHAAHMSIVPSVATRDGAYIPEISVVMANFPRSTAEMPALLLRSDVRTFFHEFGHAIHALLGRTPIASYSGTNVKLDFVEMPSQMLEEWLWNPEILRMVSSHYKTGEPLPDDTIQQILKLKQFDAAIFVRNQARYALLSLQLHQEQKPDLDAIFSEISTTYAPHIWRDPENHFYASFGHLTGYSARYYGYLWSKVFALDLFSEIEKGGLLNTATGRRYAEAILVPGGTKPPHLLLQQFLGREPRIDAFIKDIGL
jgi:thimet oligopeptidase